MFDDVVYFDDALQRINGLYQEGPLGVLKAHWRTPPHSPWSSYAAMLGYLTFGTTLWAPYAVNALLLGLALILVTGMMRQHAWWVGAALGLLFLTMPFAASLVLECRPDSFYALLSAYGLWLLAKTPLLAMSQRQAIGAGMIWGAAVWVKPAVFVQTAVFLLAALAWNWRVVLRESPRPWRALARQSGICFGTACLVAAPHLAVNFRHYVHYIKSNLLGVHRQLWVYDGSFLDHVTYYLHGQGGVFMFGATFWLLVPIVLITLALVNRNTHRDLGRQLLDLTVFSVGCWVLACLNAIKSPFFGMTFGCLFLFTSMRCLAAWLGGELRLPSRWAVGMGAALTLAVFSFWRLPADLGCAWHPSYPHEATAFRAVYQELRDRLCRGERERVAMPTVGDLNDAVLRWHFRMDHARPPQLHTASFSDDLNVHLAQIKRADFVVIPDPPMDTRLSNWHLPFGKVHAEVLARLRADPELRLCATVDVANNQRILLYERRRSFAGWSTDGGLVSRADTLAAVRPAVRLRLPAEFQQQAKLVLKVRSVHAGQRLSIRAGTQQCAQVELPAAGAWLEKEVDLDFTAPATTLDFLCQHGNHAQPALEFAELRLVPVAEPTFTSRNPD